MVDCDLKRRRYHIGAGVLVFVLAVISTMSIREKSPAFDELFHVTGGYSYWTTNDYRLHPTNGNLVQRWTALPLLVMDVEFSARDLESWHRPRYHGIQIGNEFFYGLGNEFKSMLWWSRCMVIILSCALGVVIYSWSARLFGVRGALVSLGLYCFSPTVIAHGRLVTSDLAGTLFFALATMCMWQALHKVTVWTVVLSAFAVAALFVTKFSAPLFVFVAAIMVIVRLVRRTPIVIKVAERKWKISGLATRIGLICVFTLVHIAVTWSVIWTCYGFRYSAFEDTARDQASFDQPWEKVLDLESTLAAGTIDFAMTSRILPEAYLYGMAHTLRFSQERATYLRGDCSRTGWFHFYPYCYLIKSSLAIHGIVIGSLLTFTCVLVGASRSRRWPKAWGWIYRTSPLWILFVVYWIAAVQSNLNLGVRHLLPVYPPIFILCGVTGYWFDSLARRVTAAGFRLRDLAYGGVSGLIVVTILFHVREAWQIHPNYLAYFNQLIGGPSQGYRHLVDNNLDWGQDLPGLSRWLQTHELTDQSDTDVFLEYFGVGSPTHYGIKAVPLKPYIRSSVAPGNPLPWRPGVYCISATIVAGPNEPFPKWTENAEDQFTMGMKFVREYDRREAITPEFRKFFSDVGLLQVEKMLAYFRQREPDETVNHSIHIYRLSGAEIREAMRMELVE